MALDPTGRGGPGTLDPTMETSTQRIRHPIRRPTQRRTNLTTQPSYTVKLTALIEQLTPPSD
ncbi:MAG: hypothetical protein VB036_09425, partial [Propionicimonas sp.]|nr:hypothetical protein [Propionicimonas sp.]